MGLNIFNVLFSLPGLLVLIWDAVTVHPNWSGWIFMACLPAFGAGVGKIVGWRTKRHQV